MSKRALVIGSGFGGISLAIRLQAMGFSTTILEKLDKPGGRGYQKSVEVEGIGTFKFDMGPTVITVPHFIEELFSLKKGDIPSPKDTHFTDESLAAIQDGHAILSTKKKGKKTLTSPTFAATNNTQKYVDIVPVSPFYRIYFTDGTFFDYDGDYQNTIDQILALTSSQEEVEGFKRFHQEALEVFQRGFLQLGFTHFSTPWDMISVIPDLLNLDVVRTLFGYVQKYFKHEKTQQVFSFEPLLIGGNPYSVPAIYVMIHFVEKIWGVHYAMGGTGKLVNGLVQKFEELGGSIRYNSEVEKLLIENGKATGVILKNGERIESTIVCSNADYAHTYNQLVQQPKLINSPFKVKHLTTYSMSLFVIYFAFKHDPNIPLALRHHNIILSGQYEEELEALFKTGDLHPKFSQYLHIPTYTDPSMAPKGYHTAYTLVCVPNKKIGNHDWDNISEQFSEKVLTFIEEKGYIPQLKKRLVHTSFINPNYFESTLNSIYGNAFGVAPLLRQSAFFRPHNASGDIINLYCVGASYQPGAGVPAVMMSAKMTAKIIAKNHNVT